MLLLIIQYCPDVHSRLNVLSRLDVHSHLNVLSRLDFLSRLDVLSRLNVHHCFQRPWRILQAKTRFGAQFAQALIEQCLQKTLTSYRSAMNEDEIN